MRRLATMLAALVLILGFTPVAANATIYYSYACTQVNIERQVQEGRIHLAEATVYVTGRICSDKYGNASQIHSVLAFTLKETGLGYAAGLTFESRGTPYTVAFSQSLWVIRIPGMERACVVRIVPICSYTETFHMDFRVIDSVYQPPQWRWGLIYPDNSYAVGGPEWY